VRERLNELVNQPHFAILAVLVATNLLTTAAFVTSPEIFSIWAQKQDTITAYASRVAQLRGAVDQLRFREYSEKGNASLELQDLSELQVQLGEQLAEILLLTNDARGMGVDLSISLADSVDLHSGPSVARGAEIDRIRTDLLGLRQEAAVAAITLANLVAQSADTIVDELQRVGHAPEPDQNAAVGGPFLVTDSDNLDGSEAGVELVVVAMERLSAARDAMRDAPIHAPLERTRVSSSFGIRKDPFTGQSAFHSGIDFPAPSGTPVVSAARGVVTFVGWRDGYGNVVEITHESGLVSRYPHLSKSLVKVGRKVEADEQVALVGSTGRSTGPHLHFEIRKGEKAIDPTPFLAVGRRLAAFDT
jgi:murein DD-endopeptidase MepM/ murein hydrolase activator NlpD